MHFAIVVHGSLGHILGSATSKQLDAALLIDALQMARQGHPSPRPTRIRIGEGHPLTDAKWHAYLSDNDFVLELNSQPKAQEKAVMERAMLEHKVFSMQQIKGPSHAP